MIPRSWPETGPTHQGLGPPNTMTHCTRLFPTRNQALNGFARFRTWPQDLMFPSLLWGTLNNSQILNLLQVTGSKGTLLEAAIYSQSRGGG